MMLQQDKPEDFVIATGVQYSVRQFIEWTAKELGISLRWEGSGVEEVGFWGDKPIVRIDARYFRPTEVDTLLGDPTKAKDKLGWMPEITARRLPTNPNGATTVYARLARSASPQRLEIAASVARQLPSQFCHQLKR